MHSISAPPPPKKKEEIIMKKVLSRFYNIRFSQYFENEKIKKNVIYKVFWRDSEKWRLFSNTVLKNT